MLPYAGYVDPESTLAIGVHHDGHLEATERTFCSLSYTFIYTVITQYLEYCTCLHKNSLGKKKMMECDATRNS